MRTLLASLILLAFSALTLAAETPAPDPAKIPPAPLFHDPVYNGAADAVAVWNRQEKSWWMFYTNRRANVPGLKGVSWVHGTDIGIAASRDGGRTWTYRGIAKGLDYKPGRNTWWAPDVVYDGGRYHMFVVFIEGVPASWAGERHILHYTSANLLNWEFKSEVALSSRRVIDACLQKLPGGSWRMWYKDEADKSHIWAADSPDLNDWKVKGPVLTNFGQEGPFVFKWQGVYWMITDSWRGQSVYRSADCEKWTPQRRRILEQPGKRPEDGVKGGHASVMVQGDEAYVVYFVHYDRRPGQSDQEGRPSALQVARLAVKDGELVSDRDTPFAMDWTPQQAYVSRGGEVRD